MKKLLAIVVLGLLSFSCSDNNEQQKTEKKPNKYLNQEVHSNLYKIQLNKDRLNKASNEKKIKILSEPSVSKMYSEIGGQLIVCETFEKSIIDTKPSKAALDIMKEMIESSKKECAIFMDLHLKYDKKFKEIAYSKQIPPFFYFKYKDPDMENAQIIGLFETEDECLSVSKKIQIELEYFIMGCKYFVFEN